MWRIWSGQKRHEKQGYHNKKFESKTLLKVLEILNLKNSCSLEKQNNTSSTGPWKIIIILKNSSNRVTSFGIISLDMGIGS